VALALPAQAAPPAPDVPPAPPALIVALALPAQAAPPAPDVPLPRSPARLAAAFTSTTRALRRIAWDGSGAVPADYTLYALHHQRILRRLAASRSLGDRTLRALPDDVRGEAADTVAARRAIDAIPRGKPPRVRVAAAAPASTLRAIYGDAERAFGISWSTLAAVNFVESAFGRVRSASEAGARGPMQFLPSIWKAYGNGGDIEDPHDAIFAAARFLKANGGSLYAYNHSLSYVRAVKRFAARMRRDERTFRTYYAWQVYVRTPGGGTRRITGPR
jgi:membrane-bound lytic murein transglycosylase B